jgi:type I restriction enzyme M protein
MLDARNIYRKVSRAIYDFSPEQQKNIASIIWLYRGTGLSASSSSWSPISRRLSPMARRRKRRSPWFEDAAGESCIEPTRSRLPPQDREPVTRWPKPGRSSCALRVTLAADIKGFDKEVVSCRRRTGNPPLATTMA